MSITGEFERIVADLANSLAPGHINRPLDLDGWRARLEAADPGLLDEISLTVSDLERLVPMVVASFRRMDRLTSRFCDTFYDAHPAPDCLISLVADREREQVEDRVGVMRMWRLADQILDAHPDSI